MAINKVQYGNRVLLDLTSDTVTAASLLSGMTAHDASGAKITGEYVPTLYSTYDGSTATVTIHVEGEMDLQAKTVTPSETAQTITADAGYAGLSEVEVSAISSTYVGSGVSRQAAATITPSASSQVAVAANKYTTGAVTVDPIPSEYVVPSGSQTITENGTYDVTNKASVDVDVSSGASNYVQGTFTTNSASGVQTISIPYTGSGYPIAAMVFIKDGAYNSANTEWYNSVQRYAIGQWTMSKAVTTSSPTYGTSGTQNQAVTTAVYKNSTSSSTSYTRTSAMNTNTFSSSNASNSAALAVRFKSATQLSVYVASTSYGLLDSTEYEYHIIYSS